MSDSSPLRIGLLAPAPLDPWAAAAYADVLEHELTRRLGPVRLDLRIDGPPLGPWRSRATADWPDDVDLIADLEPLHGNGVPPLTTLFHRTVDDVSADVRSRMLEHLGIPGHDRPLTDDDLVGDVPWRPTDLWILARRNGVDDRADERLRALAGDVGTARLDDAFDELAASISDAVPEHRPETIARLREQIIDLTHRLERCDAERGRIEIDAVAQLDQLAAELRDAERRADRGEPNVEG